MCGCTLQNIQDVFGRPSDCGTLASHNDGALDQYRICDHCRDEFIVGQARVVEAQLGKRRFGAAHQPSWIQIKHRQQSLKGRRVGWCVEVIYDIRFNAAFFQQRKSLTGFGAAWIVVDGDFTHGLYNGSFES